MSALPNRILLATDDSPDTALATTASVDLSSRSGAELHVVYVGRSVSAYARPTTMPKDYSFLFVREVEELMEWQTGSIGQAGGTIAQPHLRYGRPADEILDLAEDLGVGMIFVGSRGLGPVERLVMGSVSEDLAHRASRGLGITERMRQGYATLGSVSTKVVRASRGPVLVCPRKRTGTG